MSLVLEALRRVEKPDSNVGSVGVAVAAYRPVRGRRSVSLPLLLGLGVGGVIVFFFGPEVRNLEAPDALSSARAGLEAAPRAPLTKARTVLPPMKIVKPAGRLRPSRNSGDSGALLPAGGRHLESKPSLILQAISERDARPIAIINDQLVKEGDQIGRIRVLKIDADSVDVLLENGRRETVRFAPPPPESSPSPDPR